jgi:hypothetical protein
MSQRGSALAAWAAFVLLIGTAAYLSLAACDFGPHPLFALRYCRAPERDGALVAEQDRERVLLDRLYRAQLNLSRLPVCLPEPPRRREPDRRAELVPTPTPTLTPTPIPGPTPTPSVTPAATPTPDERLSIPRSLSELNGCWQSDRGEIPFLSDDAEHRPIGSVRICYCFDKNGRGSSRYKYNDGTRCTGPLKALLSQDRLSMSHGRINCVGNPAIGYVVGADVVCSRRQGEDSASCDTDWHFRYPTTSKDEKFRRVSAEYCN